MGYRILRKRLGLVFNNDEQWIGGTYYTLNLINALSNLVEENQPEIVVFSNIIDFSKLKTETEYKYLAFENLSNSKESRLLKLYNKIWYKIFKRKLIRKVYKGKLDALFILQRSEYLENFPVEKRYYWIPDFQDKHYPEFFTEEGLIQKDSKSKWIHQNTQNLILSSNAVKKDWDTFYPNYHGKTTVIHFAVTHPDYNNLEIDELMEKHDLKESYFFSPNQFWAHKNHIVVIKAVQQLKEQGIKVLVAFSGKENDNRNPGYTESLKEFVVNNNLQEEIRFLGFLDRKEQLKLMKHSIAIIQPSLFEGWSTVIEDAMLMNQTIIASNLDVNIEQLGDQGFYFDPNDPKDLSSVLLKVKNTDTKFDYNYKERVKAFANNFINLVN